MSESKPDLLNRKPFIDGLCETLKNPGSTKCQIIAIEGGWGAGKTFVIGKIKSHLEEERLKKKNRILWIDFNPWSFKDKDHLTSLFFAELKSRIFKKKKNNLKRFIVSCIFSASLLTLLYIQFYDYLPFVLDFLVFIKPTLCLVALVLLPVLLVSSESRQVILKLWRWIKPLLLGETELQNLISAYAELLEGEEAEKSNDTLSDAKDKISKELKNCDKFDRIIVSIEDLDRLTPKEVCDVIQFVRMIADFDKITYLLAYDRDQVVCALGSLSASRTKADREEYGAGFLRRVVERSIPLPEIDRAQLTAIMTDDCQDRLKAHYGEEAFSTEYWKKVSEVVFSLCPTLREGQRVITRADMVAIYIKEISNPADVVLFSYMSQYQIKAWDCLKNNFGKPDYYYLIGKGARGYEKSQDNPLTHIKEDQEDLQSLIGNIDPYLKEGSEDVDCWIGSRGYFPVYISYSSTSVAEGEKEAKRILSHTDNYLDFDWSSIVREDAQTAYYGAVFGVLRKNLSQDIMSVQKAVTLLENLPVIFKNNNSITSADMFGPDLRGMMRDVIVQKLSTRADALVLIKRVVVAWFFVENYPISLGIMYDVLISNSEKIAKFKHRDIVLNNISFDNMSGDFQELYFKKIKQILGMSADAIKENRLGMHLAVCAALAEGSEKDEIKELIEGQDIKTLLLSMRGHKESTGIGEVESCFSKAEIKALFWYMGADTHSIIEALFSKVGDDDELKRALRNTQNMSEPVE